MRRDDHSPPAGETSPRACSYAELREAEQLATRLGESGREVLWRSIWVRTEPELHFAGAALAGTLLGLLAMRWTTAAGIALALLLALWSLEVGGLSSPLGLLRPERATQDVIAPDPTPATGVKGVLLLVRADLPRRPSRAVARVCDRGREFAWIAISLTLALTAGRSLGWRPSMLDALQLVPAIGSLVLLAAALLARSAPLGGESPGWTGIDQAIEAAARLTESGDGAARFDIVIAGATGLGGGSRVLAADPTTRAACRCWQYRSGEEVVAAIRRSRD